MSVVWPPFQEQQAFFSQENGHPHNSCLLLLLPRLSSQLSTHRSFSLPKGSHSPDMFLFLNKLPESPPDSMVGKGTLKVVAQEVIFPKLEGKYCTTLHLILVKGPKKPFMKISATNQQCRQRQREWTYLRPLLLSNELQKRKTEDDDWVNRDEPALVLFGSRSQVWQAGAPRNSNMTSLGKTNTKQLASLACPLSACNPAMLLPVRVGQTELDGWTGDQKLLCTFKNYKIGEWGSNKDRTTCMPLATALFKKYLLILVGFNLN